jgi:radical SAM-linked protein
VIDRPDGSPDEPRQRWRIVFARDAATTGPRSDDMAAWTDALGRSGLPVAYSLGKTPRPRLSIAAPLPNGVSAEAELADLVLTERLTAMGARARLAGHLPAGHRLVDLFDVWLGAPALTAQLAAADYRVSVLGATTTELGVSCATLLCAGALERTRPKGDGRTVTYDLRPLIVDLSATESGSLRMRLRHAQDGPAGRPEEVVLALGETLDRPLELGPTVRERLLTVDMIGVDRTPLG